MLRFVVGQEPRGVAASEPGLRLEVALSVLEALVVFAALGAGHPLAFNLAFLRSLDTTARESAPEGSEHLPSVTNRRQIEA